MYEAEELAEQAVAERYTVIKTNPVLVKPELVKDGVTRLAPSFNRVGIHTNRS